MKNLIRTFLYGATMAFGTMAGISLFGKLSDPVSRAKIKKKFINIKDIVFKKGEES